MLTVFLRGWRTPFKSFLNSNDCGVVLFTKQNASQQRSACNFTLIDGGSVYVPDGARRAFLRRYAEDVDAGREWYVNEMLRGEDFDTCRTRAFFEVDIKHPLDGTDLQGNGGLAALRPAYAKILAVAIDRAIDTVLGDDDPLRAAAAPRAHILGTEDKFEPSDGACYVGLHVVVPDLVVTVSDLHYLTSVVAMYAARETDRQASAAVDWCEALDLNNVRPNGGGMRLPGSFKAVKCGKKGVKCESCSVGEPADCMKFAKIARSYKPAYSFRILQEDSAVELQDRAGTTLSGDDYIYSLVVNPFPEDARTVPLARRRLPDLPSVQPKRKTNPNSLVLRGDPDRRKREAAVKKAALQTFFVADHPALFGHVDELLRHCTGAGHDVRKIDLMPSKRCATSTWLCVQTNTTYCPNKGSDHNSSCIFFSLKAPRHGVEVKYLVQMRCWSKNIYGPDGKTPCNKMHVPMEPAPSKEERVLELLRKVWELVDEERRPVGKDDAAADGVPPADDPDFISNVKRLDGLKGLLACTPQRLGAFMVKTAREARRRKRLEGRQGRALLKRV